MRGCGGLAGRNLGVPSMARRGAVQDTSHCDTGHLSLHEFRERGWIWKKKKNIMHTE